MVKLVVSSFYNGLIDKEEAIPFSSMLEIERIRKKGVLFAVCTNKLYTEVLDYNRDFPFLDYIISLNGAYVYDLEKEECIFKKKLDRNIIDTVIDNFSNHKLYFYSEDSVYQEFDSKDIYKIDIEYSKKVDLDCLEKLDVNISHFKYNKKNYLEITSSSCNNFMAVDCILNSRNIDRDETVVITSNEADLELVKNINNNYVLSNAYKELKEFSNKKTKSNNQKGVEIVLKTI